MKNFSRVFTLFTFLFLTHSLEGVAAERSCLENICIGDDVDAIDTTWKTVEIDYKTNRAVKGLLAEKTVDELYYDNYVQLITDQNTLKNLAPKVIQLQKFDASVLETLASVKAICTPLTLTGEIENNSKTKMLVTFRVVADEGGRGRLRVVQLEKEFNIFPPHLRPRDKDKYIAMVAALKSEYPSMVLVRDIDERAYTNEVAFANMLLGYRFFSDVNTPLVFRIRDLADIESIEVDPKRSPLCPAQEY